MAAPIIAVKAWFPALRRFWRGGGWLLVAAVIALASIGRAQTTDPAKVADLQQRFQSGLALQQQGKWAEARAVYDKIIADEPKARGSLYCAGMCSNRLGEYEKAIDYLEKMHTIAPKDYRCIVQLIQANQALRRTPRVETLRKELTALRVVLKTENPDLAKLPENDLVRQFLSDPMYARERVIDKDGSMVEITEAFDYHDQPNAVYMAQQIAPNGELQRRLFISYDVEGTKAIRQKEPRLADAEVFTYLEIIVKNDAIAQVNEYAREFKKPEYDNARRWLLDSIKQPPKPTKVIPGSEINGANPAAGAPAPKP